MSQGIHVRILPVDICITIKPKMITVPKNSVTNGRQPEMVTVTHHNKSVIREQTFLLSVEQL